MAEPNPVLQQEDMLLPPLRSDAAVGPFPISTPLEPRHTVVAKRPEPSITTPAHDLLTDRLLIRPLQPLDRLETLRVLRLSRDHVEGWSPLHLEGEDDDQWFDRQLETQQKTEAAGTAWRRAIWLREYDLRPSRLAGMIQLNSITRGLEWEADASWWIAADCTGRGLANEAVKAVLNMAFSMPPEGLGLTAIHAGIDPSNAPSQWIARRCGFNPVPGLESHLKLGGQWVRHEFWVARPSITG